MYFAAYDPVLFAGAHCHCDCKNETESRHVLSLKAFAPPMFVHFSSIYQIPNTEHMAHMLVRFEFYALRLEALVCWDVDTQNTPLSLSATALAHVHSTLCPSHASRRACARPGESECLCRRRRCEARLEADLRERCTLHAVGGAHLDGLTSDADNLDSRAVAGGAVLA